MEYDYVAERKAFMGRLREWLKTEEGRPYDERIDRACQLEEPQASLATDGAWDIAEVEFSHRHPDQAMRFR